MPLYQLKCPNCGYSSKDFKQDEHGHYACPACDSLFVYEGSEENGVAKIFQEGNKRTFRILIDQAEAAMAGGNYEDAIKYYDNAIIEGSKIYEIPDVLIKKARALKNYTVIQQRGNYTYRIKPRFKEGEALLKKAINIADKMVKETPENYKGYVALIDAFLFDFNDPHKAMEILQYSHKKCKIPNYEVLLEDVNRKILAKEKINRNLKNATNALGIVLLIIGIVIIVFIIFMVVLSVISSYKG